MEVAPLKLGVEVTGMDLDKDLSEEQVESFKELIHEHRLVVFRNQQNLRAQRLLEFTEMFGGNDTSLVAGDPVFVHPKCPHPNINRISNDPTEGCTMAGRLGWHIDGAVFEKPFAYTIMHVISEPTRGATEYVGFSELLDSLDTEKFARWERLWSVPNKPNGKIHPLIYKHPVSGKSVMCFHLGFTESYIWDYGTESARVTTDAETENLKEEIEAEITKNDGQLIYAHPWKAGDFAVTDNLASVNSQRPRSEVGLRVLHRTTVKGRTTPRK